MSGISLRIVKELAMVDKKPTPLDACVSAYFATKRAVPDLTWEEHVKWWSEFQRTRQVKS